VKSHSIKDAAREAMRDVADRAGEQVQSAELRERLTPIVEQAIQVAREQAGQAAVAAGHARDWAAPRVEAAMEWAAPRVERGLQAAAPKVEAAADRVAPAVDAARDRIVDDLLPRLIDAVHAAGAAGSAATSAATATATDTVSRGIENAARSLADATPTAKADRRRKRSRLVLLAALFAALAAGAAAFKRSRSQHSSWEEAPTAVPATPFERPLGAVNDTPMSAPAAVTEAEVVPEPEIAVTPASPADVAPSADLSDTPKPGAARNSADLGADADGAKSFKSDRT
jgi:hypothetical protein